MSQKQLESKNMDSKTTANGRRKFLVKASAGALVASIPAQSVWATTTMNAGSVMGSNHGSDISMGQTMHLKKPHEWASLFGTQLLEVKYKDIAHAAPKVKNILKDHIGSANLGHLRLCHLLGALGAIQNYLQNDCGCEIDGSDRLVIRNNDGSVKRRATMAIVYGWIKAADSVNALLASAYLNAKLSGQHGIFYPIAKSISHPNAPFDSAESFLEYLHRSRISNRRNTVSILEQLHINPNGY